MIKDLSIEKFKIQDIIQFKVPNEINLSESKDKP